MNRIVLIGNGFDKAHNLPTGYVDFINNYWEHIVSELEQCNSYIYEDELCTFTLLYENITNSIIRTWEDFMRSDKVMRYNTALEKIEYIKHADEYCRVQKTLFLDAIDKTVETKKWVDIENEYYRLLKNIPNSKFANKTTRLEALNNELDCVKDRLVQYLNNLPSVEINERIRQIIYEPFRQQDISVNNRNVFHQFIKARFEIYPQQSGNFVNSYGSSWSKNIVKEAIEYFDSLQPQLNANNAIFAKHFTKVQKQESVPDYYLLPDQILLLNFNYTKTADMYLNQGSTFEVNHIHGEIDNEYNPVIFGYGDEMDDGYKELSRLNDNDYLKNMKSIRYLETDNYRNLLRFVDSAPFQIYILGHSCGTSDRTLLNTLFEHKNCVSIKPYFFIDQYGKDNYIELVQNISRNFENTATMRDRVVNKSYCEYFVRYDSMDKSTD